MALNRRDFLGITAVSSAALLTGESLAGSEPNTLDCNETYGVLVDTVACIGCRKCEAACNRQNQLSDRSPASFDDKSVFEKRRRPDATAYTVVNQFRSPQNPETPYTIKLQCMHCNDPACVSACIVGAMQKTPNGPVIYDAWRCIGCRYCMVACPFQVPAYEYDRALDPKVQKCTFCNERITREGKLPACVEICPNEALTFGPREELLAVAHGRIKAYPDKYTDHVYGESEVGGTSWLYLAPVDFRYAGLPALGDDPVPHATETIQHGIFKSFVPPLALYGLLGLIMHSLRERNAEEGGTR